LPLRLGDFLVDLFPDFFARLRLELAFLREPLAFLRAVFEDLRGLRDFGVRAGPLAANAPTTPPTTAPIGPATLPTAAPTAAPAASLRIGGK
jgi:hypothetical protein